jgi:hypothetical protein
VTWGRHRARSSVAWLTDRGGDVEAEEELQPGGATMATVASDGR